MVSNKWFLDCVTPPSVPETVDGLKPNFFLGRTKDVLKETSFGSRNYPPQVRDPQRRRDVLGVGLYYDSPSKSLEGRGPF